VAAIPARTQGELLMTIKPITEIFAVAPQMSAADVAAVAQLGYTTIINNRPDGEVPGQPSAAEIEALARQHGLNFVNIPVSAATMTPEAVQLMATTLQTAPGPVLAYCRSGMRSTTMWALAQAGKMPADEILHHAVQAGYDLSGLEPRLQAGV
jgi:sulfide:quinone oxidoreductase